MTNKNFGKLEGGALTYAQDYLVKANGGVIIHPTSEQYAAAADGPWIPVESMPPAPPEGQHVVGARWVERDGKIVRVYEYAPDEKVQRTFSKLKLYGAIAQIGAWDTIRSWLEGKTINGLNGWTAFQLAQDIGEDHPMFRELASEARGLLGIDEASFDALLEGCRLEA